MHKRGRLDIRLLAIILAAGLLGLGLVWWAGDYVDAAVTPNSAVDPQTPKLGVLALTTSYATLYTGGSNGSVCFGLWATSTDASARDVTWSIQRSATDYQQAVVTVAANSGNANGSYAVDLMSTTTMPPLPFNSDGNHYFYLSGSGDVVRAKASSGTSVQVMILCADF